MTSPKQGCDVNGFQLLWVMARVVWRVWFVDRAIVAAESLAYQQQLAVLLRQRPRPRLKQLDRFFWVVLSWLWHDWRGALVIVQPDTVCRWHRAGFRFFWRWKSQHGRPRKDRQLRQLMRRLARDNPLWGLPRLQAELTLLGHRVCEATIRKYLPEPPRGPRKPSSPSWPTFWKNHLPQIAAVDFFVVPTDTFHLSLARSFPALAPFHIVMCALCGN